MANDTLENTPAPASPDMRLIAAAWIDRFEALGGIFARDRSRSLEITGCSMGYPMPYVWNPPARDNPMLPPSEQLLDRSHHEGAIKVLFSLLTLTPGLKRAVYEVAEEFGAVLS
ncbi:hypothetical protein [Sphingomonas sp.]|uniref:hypothetical protein n=1 Tax=Sphingomonas sp. TaxID=28214 RepID=UPI0025CD17E2|nr:hypothetical protein [Sphingomonas sp.]